MVSASQSLQDSRRTIRRTAGGDEDDREVLLLGRGWRGQRRRLLLLLLLLQLQLGLIRRERCGGGHRTGGLADGSASGAAKKVELGRDEGRIRVDVREIASSSN